MRRLLTILACCALAGAVFAGCGGNKNTDSPKSTAASDTTSTAESTPAPAPAGGGGKAVVVDMKDIQFTPKAITAKVGQTVKWTNSDTAPHNVTATKGEKFKSSTFQKGGTYEYKLDKAGSITYVCTIHPGMEGTITVTQ